MSERVEVLMATYQSADFLAGMLESLLAQSHDDFHLVVSDDCSRDETLAILEAHAPRFRNPVRIIRRETPSGSAMANFSSLLARSEADYVFLADHDDIWMPDKIARGLTQLRDVEARRGRDTPALVHSDLVGIDEAGRMLFPSYWAFKLIDPESCKTLAQALIQPAVTGCTLGANRALLGRAVPVPEAAIMHDWWLTLVAVAFGEVVHDREPQVNYRIHGKNASRPQTARFTLSRRIFRRISAVRRGMRRRYAQGLAFRERFGDALPSDLARSLTRFAALPETPQGLRQLRLMRGGFLGASVWRNFVQLVLA